jgi:FtsZ-binding cell division protein ZapB
MQGTNRNTVIVLSIVAGLLAISLAFLAYKLTKVQKDNQVAQEAVEEQKNSLAKDLNNMMVEYDNLKTNNDSMNMKISVQQDHIHKLLQIQASNLEKIRLYKNELVTLRTVLRSYIVQIDSLNQRNQILSSENKDVKGRLSEAQKSNEKLAFEKENLSSKVKTAAVLSAKNISVVALNKRGKDTDKANKTAKLRTCFTLRENSVADAGAKTIYLRILRPDRSVLTSSQDNVVRANGAEITYSSRREIEYDNKDVDMCIYWDNNDNLPQGTYFIELYAEGKMIGSSTFALK